MAIYLDANILWSWRTFTEPTCLAVSIVARQLGQQVFVPSIAALEAEEDYRRGLVQAVENLERAHANVNRLFEVPSDMHLEPWPDVEDAVATWRRRLEGIATILPLADDDAQAALVREIRGQKPARPREPRKPGRGSRDAAIWLSIARHHASVGEEGHLLSKDRGDMSDGEGSLSAELSAELPDGAHPLRLYPEVFDFIGRLGETVDGPTISLDDLLARASTAIEQYVARSPEPSHAVWNELRPDTRYAATVMTLRPLSIVEQRRYEQSEDAVIVVNSRWTLRLECAYQRLDASDPRLWAAVQDVEAEATVQLFIEERAGELQGDAQIIGAQFAAKTTLWEMADGSLLTMGQITSGDQM